MFILSDGSEMNIDEKEKENNDYITKEIHDLFSFDVIDNPSLNVYLSDNQFIFFTRETMKKKKKKTRRLIWIVN